MKPLISVIIPNRNGSTTIGKCLEAVFSSRYENLEVIVVDDCSEDNSVEIIKRFPCRLIQLNKPSGASKARNIGASKSRGNILFFIDADCLIREDTLSIVTKNIKEKGQDVVIGGTYTRKPHDSGFFSLFQSIFINYSETKRPDSPDYIATHAMAIDAETLRKSGGFLDNFLPILEDVELSHRLRRSGLKLTINPSIIVEHIFNFSLISSIRNAIKKSMYWTIYSIRNKDLTSDSGTASLELKANVVTQFLSLVAIILWAVLKKPFILYPLPLFLIFNIYMNRNLFKAFYETGGAFFSFFAFIYYTTAYAIAVGAGASAGIFRHYLKGFYRLIHPLKPHPINKVLHSTIAEERKDILRFEEGKGIE
jgi:glycosyltransferase involved in cell wall biosynthesis